MKVRGYDFPEPKVRDSHLRRAQQFANNIVTCLKAIGVHEDDIDIKVERMAVKRTPAAADWYFDGTNMHYSYKGRSFAENLYVVSKVIEGAVMDLLQEHKTVEEFRLFFREEDDMHEERKAARELLGVPEDCLDLTEINKVYKKLAKAAHPDMPTGDTQKFKELNHAHKILKRELG